MRLSRSLWRKLAVTLVAMVGFVYLYEATTNDAVWPFQAGSVDPTRPVPGARLQFSATAYCKGTRTTSGVDVRSGIAAADPALLPVGSVLTITTDDSRYNGVYTVMDTGPAVQGREVDLYIWNCNEALAFGRKDVQVTVLRLGWSPTASTPGLIDRLFRRRVQRAATPAAIPPAAATPPPAAQPPAEGTAATPASPAAATPAPPDGGSSAP